MAAKKPAAKGARTLREIERVARARSPADGERTNSDLHKALVSLKLRNRAELREIRRELSEIRALLPKPVTYTVTMVGAGKPFSLPTSDQAARSSSFARPSGTALARVRSFFGKLFGWRMENIVARTPSKSFQNDGAKQ